MFGTRVFCSRARETRSIAVKHLHSEAEVVHSALGLQPAMPEVMKAMLSNARGDEGCALPHLPTQHIINNRAKSAR